MSDTHLRCIMDDVTAIRRHLERPHPNPVSDDLQEAIDGLLAIVERYWSPDDEPGIDRLIKSLDVTNTRLASVVTLLETVDLELLGGLNAISARLGVLISLNERMAPPL